MLSEDVRPSPITMQIMFTCLFLGIRDTGFGEGAWGCDGALSKDLKLRNAGLGTRV